MKVASAAVLLLAAAGRGGLGEAEIGVQAQGAAGIQHEMRGCAVWYDGCNSC